MRKSQSKRKLTMISSSIILSKPFVFYVAGKPNLFGNPDTKESGLLVIIVE
jgi:hypothetical protein